jgi:alpha-galactosidase
VQSCSGCAGGQDVGYIGDGGTLTVNDVTAPAAGSYPVQITYVDGDSAGDGRTADISVDGASAATFTANGDGSWNTPQSTTVMLDLNQGSNTIEFSNPGTWAPDIVTLAVNPPGSTTYVADTAGTVAGGARVQSCSGCADGKDVGYIGEGGTLTFPDVSKSVAGTYAITIVYVDGDGAGHGRPADITVDGGTPTAVTVNGDGDWNTPQTLTVNVTLAAGTDTIEFSNPGTWAPDIYSIEV